MIQSRAVALDYIGKRGSTQGVTKEKRIEYAKQVRMLHFESTFFAREHHSLEDLLTFTALS